MRRLSAARLRRTMRREVGTAIAAEFSSWVSVRDTGPGIPPGNLERLPVDPTEYRPEFQRLIVSAFFHEASTRAKHVEHA